jgi:hypothetical protein
MFRLITEWVQFGWMFESQYHQRLAWKDAEKARTARDQAETRAQAQLQTMIDANPSGQLGRSELGDSEALKKGGLL